MQNAIIELEGLTKNYGSLKAVDDLHLRINKGEIYGLLGPNGAGKTTTILMMLGLTEPTAGRAKVCGIDATTRPIEVKRKVGYMPDNLGFYDSMSALDNLVYIGRLNGLPENFVRERALEMMELVGLAHATGKKAGTYSRGMKQRLGLADVLIRQPEVIILDEPTLGIDPSGVREFLALISRLSREQGITVLLSSHHLHQVQQVCDRVGIFVGGKLLADGDVATLSRQMFGGEKLVVEIEVEKPLLPDGTEISELRAMQQVQRVTTAGNVIEVSSNDNITADLVRFAVSKGLNVVGVRKKEYGLEEIYQRYFENTVNADETNRKSNNLFKRAFIRKTDR
ncbi:ABC transporter ATP-binding protein [Chitinophaga horti]|uniref:ABC transporter ATP-binding protein n=1 Tax=Chitinophaga horti TaxID=2920382 RepID=A0ABY6JBV3_9BACT|nr:ABC transporter ATP-binding protein [Chitinophaga horti]UYQ95771.1 ABC transporter ATP-binding protein [Chitinophaga horti]